MNIPTSLPVPVNKEMWETLDSTKLQAFARCPRLFFFEYILGWRPSRTSNHLSFGRAWHAALEHLYSTWNFSKENISQAYDLFLEDYRKDFPATTDEWFKGKNPTNALKALVTYCSKYPDDLYKYTMEDCEVGGIVAIAPERMLAVKLDLLLEDEQGIFFMEHKTGGTLFPSWADQWSLSIQIGAYLHAINSLYEVNKARALINGVFFSSKTISFMRHPCMRTNQMMLSWLYTVNSLWDRIEGELEVLSESSKDDTCMSAFPLNPTSCGMFSGCPFHDLCTCIPNPLTLSGPPDDFEVSWFDPLESVRTIVKKENF